MIVGAYDPRGRHGAGEMESIVRRGLRGEPDVRASDPDVLRFATDHAPAFSPAGVRCMLDGAIYNLPSLAAELGLGGVQTPEAIIAAGWRAWGRELPGHLRGGFALLVWEPACRRGLLAEDHAGLRPCYLNDDGATLRFASNMRALLRMMQAAPSPDAREILLYIGMEKASPGATMAAGIARVAAGHVVTFDSGRWTRSRYWTPAYRGTLDTRREPAARQLREAMAGSIRQRLDDARPTGVMLSGGFDSTAVAGVATAVRGDLPPLRGYSAVFPDHPDIDESERIDAFVAHSGISGEQMHVRPQGAMRLILEYQRDWGMPLAGPGYVLERPLLRRAAADGVRIVLDGQGGDELFGFSPYVLGDRLRRARIRAAMRMLRSWPGVSGSRPTRDELRYILRRFALAPAVPYRLHAWRRRRHDPQRHSVPWVTGHNAAVLAESNDPMAWRRGRDAPLWWSFLAYLLTSGWNASGGLSEYVGTRCAGLPVESRPPLLDVDLVEFVLTLPPECALGDVDRALGRESVRGLVPDAVRLSTAKSNIGPFYRDMLAGADQPAIRRLLADPDARIFAYADRALLRERIERPPAAGERGWLEWTTVLWRLLTAECWLRSLEDEAFAQTLLDTGDLTFCDAADGHRPAP